MASFESAPEVFEHGRKSAPQANPEQIKGLHVKIGESFRTGLGKMLKGHKGKETL